MNIETRNQVLSIVLGIVILALAYFLYDAIVTPYQEVIEKEQMTERVRERMLNVKDVLVRYEAKKGHFPPTEGGLDSVIQFVRMDSMLSASVDSIFVDSNGKYSIDSLVFSPRTGAKFQYTLNDTLRPPLYLLTDPDSEDLVGSLERTTMRNAPNW